MHIDLSEDAHIEDGEICLHEDAPNAELLKQSSSSAALRSPEAKTMDVASSKCRDAEKYQSASQRQCPGVRETPAKAAEASTLSPVIDSYEV